MPPDPQSSVEAVQGAGCSNTGGCFPDTGGRFRDTCRRFPDTCRRVPDSGNGFQQGIPALRIGQVGHNRFPRSVPGSADRLSNGRRTGKKGLQIDVDHLSARTAVQEIRMRAWSGGTSGPRPYPAPRTGTPSSS